MTRPLLGLVAAEFASPVSQEGSLRPSPPRCAGSGLATHLSLSPRLHLEVVHPRDRDPSWSRAGGPVSVPLEGARAPRGLAVLPGFLSPPPSLEKHCVESR